MLKSSTGTERSDQMTTWTRTAVAEALLTENRVVSPFGSLRSTSKYGSSSVAAGTSSMVQMTAEAGAATANSEVTASSSTTIRTARFISSPPCGCTIGLGSRHEMARGAGAVEQDRLHADG